MNCYIYILPWASKILFRQVNYESMLAQRASSLKYFWKLAKCLEKYWIRLSNLHTVKIEVSWRKTASRHVDVWWKKHLGALVTVWWQLLFFVLAITLYCMNGFSFTYPLSQRSRSRRQFKCKNATIRVQSVILLCMKGF